MLRLLSIDNLSAAAYRLCTPEFEHSLRFETPARVHQLVSGGHWDAALLPSVSLPTLGGRVMPLGAFGIACRGPVGSVKLFTSLPLETLLRDRLPIYATPKSRTSVALLRVLCARVYGVLPVLTSSYPGAAAHLLIGDAAYECAHSRRAGAPDIDLGAWWLEHTGLPFTFARWVVSPALDAGTRTQVLRWISDCAAFAASDAGLTALTAAEPDPEAAAARRHYHGRLQMYLDGTCLSGLDRFLELMECSHDAHTTRIA